MQSIIDTFAAFAAWAEAHPEITALILVPVLTGLFNLAFKPRTPEQYAAIAKHSPRLAAVLQLMGALFPDPEKAGRIVVSKILKSTPPPSGGSATPFKSGPKTGGLLRLALVAALLMPSCTPDARRALLETTLDAAKCALANMNLPNDQILKVCAIDAADADRILRIVGEGRQQAAMAANQAEDRGRLAGTQHCGDAGTK
jgi:hypothetical protein